MSGLFTSHRLLHKIINVDSSKFTPDGEGYISIMVVFNARENPLCGWPNANSVSWFKIKLSDYNLPKLSYWHSGDTHSHSVYTDNAVEFGDPIEAMVEAGKSIGIEWVVITDHSFDFDSHMTNKDETWKWNQLGNDCNDYSDSYFKCIRGEEVSVIPPDEWQQNTRRLCPHVYPG